MCFRACPHQPIRIIVPGSQCISCGESDVLFINGGHAWLVRQYVSYVRSNQEAAARTNNNIRACNVTSIRVTELSNAQAFTNAVENIASIPWALSFARRSGRCPFKMSGWTSLYWDSLPSRYNHTLKERRSRGVTIVSAMRKKSSGTATPENGQELDVLQ